MNFPAQPHTQSTELDLLLGEAGQAGDPILVPSAGGREDDPSEQLDRQILAGLVSV